MSADDMTVLVDRGRVEVTATIGGDPWHAVYDSGRPHVSLDDPDVREWLAERRAKIAEMRRQSARAETPGQRVVRYAKEAIAAIESDDADAWHAMWLALPAYVRCAVAATAAEDLLARSINAAGRKHAPNRDARLDMHARASAVLAARLAHLASVADGEDEPPRVLDASETPAAEGTGTSTSEAADGAQGATSGEQDTGKV